jgi:hypothetical protein
MFKDSTALDRSRTAAGFDSAHARYAASAEKWFNGTVDSVDARLAACVSLLHRARSICGRFSINDAGRYLQASSELETDHRALVALREDLLTGAAGREDVTGPPGWRSANRPGSWYGGSDDEAAGANPHGIHPNDYSSREEYLNAVNMRSYLQDASHQFPGAGDYPVGDPGAEAQTDKPGYVRHSDPVYKPPGHKRSSLSGTDQRWVTLEAAKFVAANTDCLDDSHELATRASHHAALKTSTFTQRHSAVVCEAFVARVTELGRQSYRPPVRIAAAYQDFDPQAMFL